MIKNGILELHSWKSARNFIKKVSPKLANIIDELSPDSSYNLYICKYPYGSLILDRGVFQIPNSQNQIVNLYHSSISKNLRDDLDYNHTIPVGMVLEKKFESFMILGNRIVPATVFGEGELLALWRVLDEGKSYQDGSFWTISAGARVACTLPKITDKNSYRQIKMKHKFDLSIPKDLTDHWHVFSDVSNKINNQDPWAAEIVFFGEKWFSHKEDKAWLEFNHLLLNQVWQSSAFARNKMMLDFIFSIVQEKRNLKPNPYLADTAMHLIAIGSGITPAFAPAIDESSIPIRNLQRFFLEDYRLKKYYPIIMHMHHFSVNENRPVYYSFQIPTTMLFSPKSNNALSIMSEMRELKYIIEIMLEEIKKEHLGVTRTPLFDLAQKVQYDFLHSEKDKTNQILSINTLEQTDPYFSKILAEKPGCLFPEFSPFFKGCVKISKKS